MYLTFSIFLSIFTYLFAVFIYFYLSFCGPLTPQPGPQRLPRGSLALALAIDCFFHDESLVSSAWLKCQALPHLKMRRIFCSGVGCGDSGECGSATGLFLSIVWELISLHQKITHVYMYMYIYIYMYICIYIYVRILNIYICICILHMYIHYVFMVIHYLFNMIYTYTLYVHVNHIYIYILVYMQTCT